MHILIYLEYVSCRTVIIQYNIWYICNINEPSISISKVAVTLDFQVYLGLYIPTISQKINIPLPKHKI